MPSVHRDAASNSGRWLTRQRRQGQQPEERDASASRSAPSPASPACRAAASRPSSIETSVQGAGASGLNNAREHPGVHDRTRGRRAISTRSSTSTSRRSAARRAPTRRPTPAPSRRSATGSPSSRRRASAATSPAASRFNVKGGRCEACQGDGVDQDRDALPAGRLRPVRRLQGQALQPRNPGDPFPRQVDRRRARHDGRRGRRVLQGRADHPRQAPDPAAGRPGLHPYRPAGDDAVRAARRSA